MPSSVCGKHIFEGVFLLSMTDIEMKKKVNSKSSPNNIYKILPKFTNINVSLGKFVYRHTYSSEVYSYFPKPNIFSKLRTFYYTANVTNGVCLRITAKDLAMILALTALITDALCFPSAIFLL